MNVTEEMEIELCSAIGDLTAKDIRWNIMVRMIYNLLKDKKEYEKILSFIEESYAEQTGLVIAPYSKKGK